MLMRIDRVMELKSSGLAYQVADLLFSYQYYQEDLEKSFAPHRQILALFEASSPEPEIVGRQVTAHINVALDRFLAYLEDFKQG